MGTSRDTSEFAVDAIGHWWKKVGSGHYPAADHLLVLADCGGSNSYRTRLWKDRLQNAFYSRYNMCVKVCHYPPVLQNGILLSTGCFRSEAATGPDGPLLIMRPP